MQSVMTPGDMLMSMAPLLLLTSLPFAIGAFYLAPKMGRNPWLCAILLIIPVLNFVTGYIFFFMVAGAVLDRLNAIGDQVRDVTPFS